MPQDETVSEAELQHAIDAYDAVITHAADVTHFITSATRREAFRAALTAAAQVRERAPVDAIGVMADQLNTICDLETKNVCLGEENKRLHDALEHIAALPDVRCDEASTVARNTLNDGTRPGPFPTEPDSGPDVLGEQKGEE